MQRIIDLPTLSPTQGFVIQGDSGGDWAGYSVSAAGDVDGDGFGDLIVGAPFGNDGGNDAGEAYIVFGGAGGFGTSVGNRQVVDLTTLNAAQGFVIRGDTGRDQAGIGVSSAGDVNGDGFGDVIVGAGGGDDGGSYAGEAYVLFGGAGGFGTSVGNRQVVDLTTLNAAQGFIIQGDAAGDIAGRSVSSAGDVDGDGFDDLIVGAPGADDGGNAAGEAYVLFGGAGGFGRSIGGRQVVDLTTLGGAQGFVIQGDAERDGPVRNVSSAGDVDGDGFDDLIIGAPYGNYLYYNLPGEAYVLFGGADGFGKTVGSRQVVDLATLTGAQGFVIQGNSSAGWGVSSADVNGDGFGDVIVGARQSNEAYVLFGGAGGFGTSVDGRQVVDLTTLSGTQGFVMRVDENGYDSTGWGVSDAGDVNGDGFSDVIIGRPYAPDYTGSKAYVLFGGDDGFGTTVDGRQVVDLTTITRAQGFVIVSDNGTAGWSASAAGDVDGDGFDDVIVGDPFQDSGEAYVVFGGNFTGAVYRIGGEGDDVVRTGPGGRTIFGAQGDDTLFGNQGADSLNGGAGDDSLNGDAANDTIEGGSGDDSAIGGFGDDRALGGDGDDTLSGRDGNDRLEGEANEDRLSGDAGNDSLDGGQGRDTLFGGSGNDTLIGDGRGDVLVGGEGVDVLTGGSGFDRFVFGPGSSPVATPDTITDFESGVDKVVLRTGGHDGTFLGAAAFTGTGGVEVRWDVASHQLQVDVNGDGTLGTGDLAINGATLSTLTAQDLLFV